MPARSSTSSKASSFLPLSHPVLKAYLAKLRLWHGYIRFIGLPTLSESSKDVPLERLFVLPRLSSSPIAPETMNNGGKLPLEDLLPALARHQRLVILGDPGSGKSTLVNYITDSLSHDSHSQLRQQTGDLVPLPFVLRELDVGENVTWERLCEAFLARPTGQMLGTTNTERRAFLETMLLSGQAWVLLDGIDEIGSIKIREALHGAYEEALVRYPSCRFLLTSRVVGYEDVPFDFPSKEVASEVQILERPKLVDDFLDALGDKDTAKRGVPDLSFTAAMKRAQLSLLTERLYLTPFDDSQVRDFTRKWWMHHRGNPALAAAEADEFLAALHLRQDTRILSRVPNLLVLIALVYKVFAKLPDGRSEIYWKIAEAYLENIDRHYKLSRPLPYSYREMALWLGHVAWHMQLQRHQRALNADLQKDDAFKDEANNAEILITQDQVIELLTEAIEVRQTLPEAEARSLAVTFLDYAARRSGLFVPRGVDQKHRDRYAFMHLSFQEFFCAVHLQDTIGRRSWWKKNVDGLQDESATSLPRLRGYAARVEWSEVFVFLFELLKVGDADKPLALLRALLDEGDVDGSSWQRFDAPWPEISYNLHLADGAKSERDKAGNEGRHQPSHRLVELAAQLAMNSEVAMPLAVRSALFERCWEWELERVSENEQIWLGLNTVARVLSARCFYQEASLTSLSEQQHAEILNLSGCTGLSSVDKLTSLKSLQVLYLDGCTNLTSADGLASLKRLRSLSLSHCTGLSSVDKLGTLTSLKMLVLDGWIGLTSVDKLASLQKLETLSLSGCTGLTSVDKLASLQNLQFLYFNGCTGLTSVDKLASLQNLRFLYLGGCTGLSSVDKLASLQNLQFLFLDDCTGLSSVDKLASLQNLEYLNLGGCTGLNSVDELAGLQNLKRLSLKRSTGIAHDEVESLRKKLPRCQIDF